MYINVLEIRADIISVIDNVLSSEPSTRVHNWVSVSPLLEYERTTFVSLYRVR